MAFNLTYTNLDAISNEILQDNENYPEKLVSLCKLWKKYRDKRRDGVIILNGFRDIIYRKNQLKKEPEFRKKRYAMNSKLRAEFGHRYGSEFHSSYAAIFGDKHSMMFVSYKLAAHWKIFIAERDEIHALQNFIGNGGDDDIFIKYPHFSALSPTDVSNVLAYRLWKSL